MRKIPTAKELFALAEAAGHDSFGICSDPELQATLDELARRQAEKTEKDEPVEPSP